ncbi:hypothetical protein R80B4_01195 [Fibrobacteres bacterium R8-0-B4]
MNFFRRQVRALLLAAAVVGAFVYTAAAQTKGTFTDGRDGQKYKTAVIGGKKWMAENLNVKTGTSWCYDNQESNCKKYGRLYAWSTAAKMACPSGWHLPTREEWNALVTAAGDGAAVKALKSSSGWDENGNGTDKFGFSALPGGSRYSDGSFDYAGNYGYWWTATEGSEGNVYYRHMDYNGDPVGERNYVKSVGLSVRCIAD